MKFKRVLVLSPHTDDGELGMGGTIARLVEDGCSVSYVAFSCIEESIRECAESMKVLGVDDYEILKFRLRHFPAQRQEIQQFLYDYSKQREIDLVFVPSSQDIHQDHQVIHSGAIRIFNRSTILGYILPWNHIVTVENCTIKLEKRHVEKKIDASWNYRSQLKTRKYFNREYITSLAVVAGVKLGWDYAEAFEVVRLVCGD